MFHSKIKLLTLVCDKHFGISHIVIFTFLLKVMNAKFHFNVSPNLSKILKKKLVKIGAKL